MTKTIVLRKKEMWETEALIEFTDEGLLRYKEFVGMTNDQYKRFLKNIDFHLENLYDFLVGELSRLPADYSSEYLYTTDEEFGIE